jgi:hypothetical protein
MSPVLKIMLLRRRQRAEGRVGRAKRALALTSKRLHFTINRSAYWVLRGLDGPGGELSPG